MERVILEEALINSYGQPFKGYVGENKKTVGTFFSMGSSEAVEALGIAGMDYVILDKEHGPYGVETVQQYIRAAERRNITPLVRVKDFTRPSILKVLDVGARGIIIPMIRSKKEVEKVVEFAKYYPRDAGSGLYQVVLLCRRKKP